MRALEPTATPLRRRPPPTRPPSSIVVLPFVDLSPEKDQEYFCHGVAEEMINSLARVPGLRVISRTSAFAFQGKALEITEIGRRLHVATALEGSVRKAGRPGARHRAARRHRRRPPALVQALRSRAGGRLRDSGRDRRDHRGRASERAGGQCRGAAASTLDAEAHDAYLRGMYAMQQLDRGGDAARHRRLPRGDRSGIPTSLPPTPRWPRPTSGSTPASGILPARESVPPARWAVEKALELDPHAGRGAQGARADRHEPRLGPPGRRGRAHAAPSSSAPARPRRISGTPGGSCCSSAQHDQALAELAEAERLDPLDLQVKTQIGYVHYFLHDLDRAIEQFETSRWRWSPPSRSPTTRSATRAPRAASTIGPSPNTEGDRAGRPHGEPHGRARPCLRPRGEPRRARALLAGAHGAGGGELCRADVDGPRPPGPGGSRERLSTGWTARSTNGTAR